MSHPYGYFVGVPGWDGDELDVFVGPLEPETHPVVIVETKLAPAFTEVDEEKVLIGFEDEQAARTAFLQAYDDPRFLSTGTVRVTTWAALKDRIQGEVEKRLQYKTELPPAQRARLAGAQRDDGKVRILEHQLGNVLHRFLRHVLGDVAAQVGAKLPAYQRAFTEEAAKAIDPQARKLAEQLLADLDFDGWSVLVAPTKSVLMAALTSAIRNGLRTAGVNDGTIFERANVDAIAAAAERAAEMVGMRLNAAGELVPNPNPAWTITESTRDMIRNDVARAIEEGWTQAQLADALQGAHAFSEARSTLIARNEIGRSLVQGNMMGWRKSGVVIGKRWVLGDLHDRDDECDGNALDGAIPLDDAFSSGDEEPPAHPNCTCDVFPILEGEELA